MKLNFSKISKSIDHFLGLPSTCLGAFTLIILWLGSGHFFEYSDSWQIFINTLTSIITFLMVFFIQNSQDRNSKAIQLKLDELLRSMQGARNDLIDVEEMDEVELEAYKKEFARFTSEWRSKNLSRHSPPENEW